MDIRRLRPGDGAVWKALSVEAMRLNPSAYICTAEDEEACPVAGFEEDLRAGRVIFVAGDGLGLISTRLDGAVLWISSVYVRSAARGQGVGDALIAAARQAALEAGCVVMRLGVFGDNAPAVDLYARHGFREVSRRDWNGRPDLVMEAAL